MPNFPRIARAFHALCFEDWLLKSICLALAVLLWCYIDGELTDRRDFVVPMRPSDVLLPPGWTLAPDRALPKFLVLLRGPRRHLQLISADSIVLQKKVSRPVAGPNPLSIEPGDLQAEGFEVISVSPKEAVIVLVSTTKRLKRVLVKTVGKVRQGFVAEAGTADPDQVSIEGQSNDLDAIDHVWTEDVDITNAEQDVVREVGIAPFVEANGRQLNFRCTTPVRTIVSVHPEQAAKRLTLDVRPLPLPGTAMTIEPATVEVEAQGEPPDLAAPDLKSNIILFADWPNNWERPKDDKTVLGPQQVQVRAFSPPRVQVRGVNGGPLPTVEVRGALSGLLQPKK
ncbi:MAG: YbbR-like domain-containing protein [Planctomycetota bacterium]